MSEADSDVTAENIDADPQSTEVFRPPNSRPAIKLSVRLIETYKHINKIYYEEKAKRLSEQADITRGGVHNDGYDDVHYDYILVGDEIILDRYIIKHRIGKGSFGQVVCAYDKINQCEVAIKIIKSKRPFYVQAQTEVELLNLINRGDPSDDSNIVRMQHTFVHKNHQCLVFEMLSYNLYELLKNTKFKGISLTLIRKFARQLLHALQFLASPQIDIVHCDLKPENILLLHPHRSAIKIIDFGSSCLRTKRSYTYIQSRFYRSPEVLLGMPYDQKIDIWSLGCVLVEMHLGQPLFGGNDQEDQMCRIVDVMGMPSAEFLDWVGEKRAMFFERVDRSSPPHFPQCDPTCVSWDREGTYYYVLKRARTDAPPPRSLEDILGVRTGGPGGRRRDDITGNHSEAKYMEFLSFIRTLLVYDPDQRASAQQALSHQYIMSHVTSIAAASASPTTTSPDVHTQTQIQPAFSQSPTTSNGQQQLGVGPFPLTGVSTDGTSLASNTQAPSSSSALSQVHTQALLSRPGTASQPQPLSSHSPNPAVGSSSSNPNSLTKRSTQLKQKYHFNGAMYGESSPRVQLDTDSTLHPPVARSNSSDPYRHPNPYTSGLDRLDDGVSPSKRFNFASRTPSLRINTAGVDTSDKYTHPYNDASSHQHHPDGDQVDGMDETEYLQPCVDEKTTRRISRSRSAPSSTTASPRGITGGVDRPGLTFFPDPTSDGLSMGLDPVALRQTLLEMSHSGSGGVYGLPMTYAGSAAATVTTTGTIDAGTGSYGLKLHSMDPSSNSSSCSTAAYLTKPPTKSNAHLFSGAYSLSHKEGQMQSDSTDSLAAGVIGLTGIGTGGTGGMSTRSNSVNLTQLAVQRQMEEMKIKGSPPASANTHFP